ncbi:MAG TPA: NADH-ubiquinone oxidoreductase-F iron-sulfur binding region domain-containing protein [Bacteroidales bacterium]|nr:NADH-ubiquinone oxidoreductase-F iron-sulfur binding region domain-containing protein [Bacteroidales bacterium]HRT80982.1 NADH-ubiquinone oxidoreductase-F iron-sulfur binding region domain-containing protein [Bacteroidales bacterium]
MTLKDITYNYLFKSTELFEINNFTPDLNIDIPVVFAFRSTCSIIAGIDDTISYIEKYINENSINIKIVETSCPGLCSFDPVIGVKIPGRTLILLKNLYYYEVFSVFDSILNHFLPDTKFLLAQIYDQKYNSWPEFPDFFSLKQVKIQKRNILEPIKTYSPISITDYFAKNGFKGFAKVLTKLTPSEVCSIIENSELKGRGGGGFFTGKKWRKALENNNNPKYFICNADESDPGSVAGRILIETDPFKLIEGMLIGAYAINASKAIIYVRNTYKLAIERLKKAIEQTKSAGLSGDDIFGSGINLSIEIVTGPIAYVCGEETALISSLEGSRGMPKPKPPYPSDKGFLEKPTIVNNVETIFNIPSIILYGAESFKQTGIKESFGTKLFTISGKVDYPGVYEIELGTSIADVLSAVCDDESVNSIKAVHIGGPSGGFIHPDKFYEKLVFNDSKNKSNDIWFGAGSFVVLNKSNCIVDVCKYFLDFDVNESCGKCIPCREGTRVLYDILKRISERPPTNSKHETLQRFKGVTQLEEIAVVMQETSLCGLGQNAPITIITGLKYFRDEFEEHIYEKKCDAGVCRDLKLYNINIDNCVGCGLCVKRCPADAIIGSLHTAHFIVQERCIKCGNCFKACKFNAVNII